MSAVVSHFLDRFQNPKKTSNGWVVCCPAHGDKHPSLDVAEGYDGRVLLDCKVGCSLGAILAALGLSEADLFEGPTSARREEHVYSYFDDSGEHLIDVVRSGGKQFVQRRPSPAGGWIYNAQGVPHTLYRLPELLADQASPVYVVEGEKDVESLRQLGFLATTTRGGCGSAAGAWTTPGLIEPLRGRTIYLVPDNDDAGHRFARIAGDALQDVAGDVYVLELHGARPGYDVSDFLAEGHDGRDIEQKASLASPFATWSPATSSTEVPTFTESSQAIELIPAWTCTMTPPPQRWILDHIIPEDQVSILFGMGGVGKSYFALSLACAVATGTPFLGREVSQETVLYLETEGMGRDLMLRRLAGVSRSMGLDAPPKRLYWQCIDTSLTERAAQLARAIAAANPRPTFLVLDSVMSAMPEHDQNDARTAYQLIRRLMPTLGIKSVLALDHSAKPSQQNPAGRAGTPFGSVYKHNLSRSMMEMVKTRKGFRLHQQKTNCGDWQPTIEVETAFDDGAISYRVVQPESRPSLSIRQRVLACLPTDSPGVSPKSLIENLRLKPRQVGRALEYLKDEGAAYTEARGRWLKTK